MVKSVEIGMQVHFPVKILQTFSQKYLYSVSLIKPSMSVKQA